MTLIICLLVQMVAFTKVLIKQNHGNMSPTCHSRSFTKLQLTTNCPTIMFTAELKITVRKWDHQEQQILTEFATQIGAYF